MLALLDWFIHDRARQTADALSRARLLVALILFGACLSTLLSTVRTSTEGFTLTLQIAWLGVALQFSLLIWFRLTGALDTVADAGLLLIAGLITSIAWTDYGLYSRTMIWLPTIPLLANFICRRLRAWNAVVLVLLMLLLLKAGHFSGAIASLPLPQNDWARVLAFLASTVLVSVVAGVYERNRKAADAQRNQLEALQRRWVSVVSHELRTPLTALRGALALGQQIGKTQAPETLQNLLGISLRNTERLTRLVNELLQMEQIVTGHLRLQCLPTHVPALLQETADTYRAAALQRDIELQIESDVSEPFPLDPDRITQVLHNLTANAVKFSRPGHAVRLSARRTDDDLCISVSNSGPGIPAELAPRLFTPFSQAADQDDRQYGGFGLGLSICRAIVEKHQGTIGFENLQPEGCRFFFSLPNIPVAAESGGEK